MEIVVTIVEFLAILGVVVVVHEFGHFAAMKAFGIRVNEFGIGFPPRLIGFRKGETLYSLNLIPIGGFIKPEGENDPSVARSFAGKGVGIRFIVLVAGVFMNVVLAIVLFTAFFTFTTEEKIEHVLVGEVSSGSPAELAGIRPGDSILEVNGNPVPAFEELRDQIYLNLGDEIELLIQHKGAQQRINLVPRVDPPPGEGAIGVTPRTPGVRPTWSGRPPWEALALGAEVTLSVPGALTDAVIDWIWDDGEFPFAGPVGIAQGTGEWGREFGLISLIPLAALLSVSLAILNILPIPALDGGRVVFVILEWLCRGKRVSSEKEGVIHVAGFVAIIGLLVALSYNDIMRIVEGNSMLR